MSVFILSLSDPQATLETVGGKGMSLARLARASLPVPPGFHINTEAYRRFVAVNRLQPSILEALAGVDAARPAELEAASARIASAFAAARMPDDLASEIRSAYAELCDRQAGKPVAVRSSATAEDLPEASFAGQQETYLNIQGPEAVLAAVQQCWASLWTARAIAYRAGQGIAPDCVALAVVVQELVCAEASGVMFTANPINGSRDELMITATWGLGEALVSGSVTPDTLTLAKSSGKLLRRDTADKLQMTVRTASGTREEPVPASLRRKPVLSNSQARNLARIGADIEHLYGMPMDIEWTLAAGRLAIVQARPITALPVPSQPLEWPLPHPKAMLARGSFAEFVPEPVSPLFATLAIPIVLRQSGQMMRSFNMGDENSYLVTVINDYVYIGFIFTPRMIWKMVGATFAVTGVLVKSSRERGEAARAACLQAIDKWAGRPPRDLTPVELLDAVRELFTETASFYNVAQSGPIPASMMSESVFGAYYNALVRSKRKGDPEAVRFVFGTENHALRAEKALYDLAQWARGSVALAEYLLHTPTDEIVAALSDPRPSDQRLSDFAARFDAYLKEHGHAIYDLDFAKPIPAEMPAAMLETLKVYLEGRNNPYERQGAALALRQQAEASIARRLDPLRRKYFLKLLHWAQDLAPLREDAIADLGLVYPLLRSMLGELGRRLVAAGALTSAQDIYWLEADELQALAGQLERNEPLGSQAAAVDRRKAHWEAMRSVIAPTTLPKLKWAKAFYPGMDADASSTIKGFGASAGRVTARACVMLGPEDFGKMQPGDVIVAGITTPAWTPLFARAAAIVTDIGGPLSHSSIVAREYGIPAVLATGVGTRRIKDGQIITVDGTAGTVVPASS